MVFFGCVFIVVASIMMCCACGFLAFSNSSKSVITITQQPQMVNQMPMGSYFNQPKPPPFMATGYQASQPQVPAGAPVQPAPYPSGQMYTLPPTVPPSYDQTGEAPGHHSMPGEKY
ncbi:unnamed protein product [Hydatigera taeniaeformis]|uniref:Protein shisa-5 n=1 Tax=Hydatigena taeniaeformis TaxID=6205 RepID=A0A0R3X2A9_HYDTA|nr:unnamed protein product [Hydatigera taeniaeformis]